MATTTRARPRADTATKPAPFGPDHEALLLEAYAELPEALTQMVQSVEPLNAKLREVAEERRAAIEVGLAKAPELPPDQVALWRAVPDIQFSGSGLPEPTMTLAHTLYRRVDARGERKAVPEALCVVDFRVDMALPQWFAGSLRSLGSTDRLKVPTDALDYLGAHPDRQCHILGLVFTSDVTVGQATREVERVRQAAMIASNGGRHHISEPDPFILCVTPRLELARILSEQVDVMYVDQEDPGNTTYFLDHLESAVGVR